MKKSHMELDPDGDVILILIRPNSPADSAEEKDVENEKDKETGEEEKAKETAISQPGHAEPVEIKPDATITLPTRKSDTPYPFLCAICKDRSTLKLLKPAYPDGKPVIVGFRVSSKHLSLASPVFQKMLSGPWKEGAQTTQKTRCITTSEWDAEALLILLDIIHGHHRDVPKSLDIETLGRIAILVDYYQCHEIIEIFGNMWLNNLNGKLPTSIREDLMTWLFVSSVFSCSDVFEKISELAVRKFKAPFETDLPMPSNMLEALNDRREGILVEMAIMLARVQTDLTENQMRNTFTCGEACGSILLGSLIREMSSKNLTTRRLRPWGPHTDISVDEARRAIQGFQSPAWYSHESAQRLIAHPCRLSLKLEPLLKPILEMVKGLRLEDIPKEANLARRRHPSFDYAGFVVGEHPRTATLWGKSAGIIAGRPFFDEVFAQCGCVVEWHAKEGDELDLGGDDHNENGGGKVKVATVTGPARGLLLGERVALNTLARCSGIATRSKHLVSKLRAAGYNGILAGTRKTTPGFRLVEKYGMLVGGADTHRVDLSAMIMLKDNHVWSRGSITDAVLAAKSVAGFSIKVEVEVQSEAEADEAIAAGADVVMLDNFTGDGVRVAARSLKERWAGKKHFLLEVSGG
ncbi:Nicotinate-nucleotide pyrophosphorylase [Cladobotryum mycophilum]|uniref:nicotinate-nucleotide diphosphorylase (carboxylating) n=1 Tax=Cladobotryum mycophilum TaxID=491253 RepID=A0ABR0SGC7_9HYPO